MGIGDRSAFPEHLDTKEEVEAAFPDDSQYKGFFGNLWKRWNKATKHWDAFGPRSPKGFAFSMWPPFVLMRKWREYPTTIFAWHGGGYLRLENTDSSIIVPMKLPKFIFFPRLETSAASVMVPFYLSRIQPWVRWHIQLQWPLFFCFHWYKTQGDVQKEGEYADRDGKLTMGYVGAKRDGDRIFWYIAAYFGRNFK
jgi:hypothetical protein